METAGCEVTGLERAMRDLVALSALPAVWARQDPAGIATNLAAVLLHMLDLDFVYVCLRDQGGGPDWLRLQTREGMLAAGHEAEVCRKLAGHLRGVSTQCVLTVPGPCGKGEVRLAVIPLGGQGECGTLAAANAWRPDFPTELDNLLLGVGANQAAVVLQVRREEEARFRLAESERRFRQLAENIHEVFWLSDPPRSQLLYVSPAYETLWGRSCASLYRDPLSFLEAIRSEDRAPVVANFEKQGQGQMTSIEYRITRPDGASRWILDRSFPVKDEAGQVWRVAGIAEDITERKRAEEALREANRRKDEFLATLAHELRNPLAPIRNSIHVMRLRGLDDPQLQWSRDVIERQVRQMTRLIDDLLDVSRITRGKVELRKEVVDLCEIVNQAVETTRPLFAERRHVLNLSLPKTSLYFKADPTRLEQILANLLNNAAKYTEPGGRVWLSAVREGADVAIRVRDNGIGIAKELLGRVFDMFVQGEQGNDRAKGGLGIGLSLVRTLVEMHGGRVAAHSEGLGTGSEFVVWLPGAED